MSNLLNITMYNLLRTIHGNTNLIYYKGLTADAAAQ